MSTAVTTYLSCCFSTLRDALAAAHLDVREAKAKLDQARATGTPLDLCDARDQYNLANDTLCQVIPLYNHVLNELDRMAIPVAVAEAAARDQLTIIHEEIL